MSIQAERADGGTRTAGLQKVLTTEEGYMGQGAEESNSRNAPTEGHWY